MAIVVAVLLVTSTSIYAAQSFLDHIYEWTNGERIGRVVSGLAEPRVQQRSRSSR